MVVETLPLGKYIFADNAYDCTEHVLTPFHGDQKNEPIKGAYNFYLSQLRIRIEMAFGRLVNKWRIFKRPLRVKLKTAGKVIMCATRLHNFCIDERAQESTGAHEYADDVVFIPSDISTSAVRNTSLM